MKRVESSHWQGKHEDTQQGSSKSLKQEIGRGGSSGLPWASDPPPRQGPIDPKGENGFSVSCVKNIRARPFNGEMRDFKNGAGRTGYPHAKG